MPISPNTSEGILFNSSAEKELLKKAISSQYFEGSLRNLFYSLEITETGNSKRSAEADFVYLDDKFIFFLEVKGGEIKYDSLRNEWWVMGGTKKQDPFRQAKDIWFQVTNQLLPELFESKEIPGRLIGGYGVMFPDVVKPQGMKNKNMNTVEYHADLIFDYYDNKKQNGFINYLERLKNFWGNHSAYKNKRLLGISTRERVAIANFFRQNLLFRLPTSELLKKEENELHQLTKQQTYVLDNIWLNKNKGAIIEGGPGTGKTILALELFKILSHTNKKILLVCYNRNLSDRLEKDIKSNSNCEIINLHSLYFQINGNIEPSKEASETTYDFYHKNYPLYIKQLLQSNPIDKFDYLIVDEAQDILNEYHFDILNMLLKDGWDSGNWAIFMDKEFQNIYNKGNEYFQFFTEVFPNFINKLNLNCRNTPSAIQTAHISTGYPQMPTLRKNEYYKTEVRYGKTLDDIYNKISNKLSKDQEVRRNTIILCYTHNQISFFQSKNNRLEEYPKKNRENTDIATIHSFKGLEKPFVILVGPENFNIEDKNQMSLLYIGITRSTTQTVMYLNEKYKDIIINNTFIYI